MRTVDLIGRLLEFPPNAEVAFLLYGKVDCPPKSICLVVEHLVEHKGHKQAVVVMAGKGPIKKASVAALPAVKKKHK